jgi:hypothetical protein
MKKRYENIFCLVLFLSSHMCGQTEGTIKGVVVDESGKPIRGAEVHIAENKPFYGHRLIQMYETDSTGQFVIPNVPWASYVVMAGKEEANYPDTKLAFYSNLAVPTVTLAPSFPTANVKVQLGPKAGTLEIESVVDALTGKKILTASVTLRRVQNPEFYIMTSATGGHILVPSLTDIAIEVSAPGYKLWPSKEAANDTTAQIRLKPEEIYKLQVRLAPETNPKENPSP